MVHSSFSLRFVSVFSGRAHLAAFPLVIHRSEAFRYIHWRSSHMNATGLCRGNALSLALANELSFRLCHIAQKLKNDVSDERFCQISSLPCIE